MADKKRKTLQIKRPDANPAKSKKKPLPKVNMNEKAATSSIDTDELTSMGPKTTKVSSPDKNPPSGEEKTTRVALPDEDKIRKARRANATQNLGVEDSLPSAEQIAHAQKNATMPIMIDTESVEENTSRKIEDTGTQDSVDRTMEIDPESLATANLDDDLADADGTEDKTDQTMEINPESLSTANLRNELADADSSKESNDQTMEINAEALETGNLQKSLEEASDTDDSSSDQTMEIDPDSLVTSELPQVQTEKIQSMETMKMDPFDDDETPEEASANEDNSSPETTLTVEKMKESFNAQTMEMDAATLAKEIAKKNTAQIDDGAGEDEELSETMDLTTNRPKTIMIKRPSRKSSSSSSTPTVKAVRPDALTTRTSRPVTANTTQAKEDTSRIDVPAGGTAEKGGKTIKLRRPSGAPASRSKSNISSRVAKDTGMTLNEDGSVNTYRSEPTLGSGWLAVAIITLLLSVGAVYSLVAHTNAELPMPGRLVDVNQQLIQ